MTSMVDQPRVVFDGVIDFESAKAACEAADRGGRVEDRFRAMQVVDQIVGTRSRWQWVIHGDTLGYRRAVCRWLVEEGRARAALQLAGCGRADEGLIGEDDGRVKVRTRGCGSRLCPRCSRRAGVRVLRRVTHYLANEPHGDMIHMVLTQQARAGESLREAMDRYALKFRQFQAVLRRVGVDAGMATFHVKWSSRGWWHYHCHFVVDLGEDGLALGKAQRLAEGWRDAVRAAGETCHPTFFRKLCEAGPAVKGVADGGQIELWKESEDPIAQCLQYAVRDVCQGCESWVQGCGSNAELAIDFAESVQQAKLHRLYGKWRKGVAEVEEGAEDDTMTGSGKDERSSGLVKGTERWVRLGTVDGVIAMAEQGVSTGLEWVRGLSREAAYKGPFSSRLRQICRRLTRF